jgi:hypothetical protein
MLIFGRIALEIPMISDEQSQAEADNAEVARLVVEGKRVTDPELLRRIRQRSDALRREMLKTQGLTNIAVDLVRDSREEG